MTETIIEILMTCIVLVAILFEEKLIALQDKFADWLAWYIAQIIVAFRRVRRGIKPKLIRYKNKPKETLTNET